VAARCALGIDPKATNALETATAAATPTMKADDARRASDPVAILFSRPSD